MLRTSCSLAVVCALLASAGAAAQSVRVIRFSEGKPFTMGEVTSMRIVHPGLGAKRTTLNYSVSKPGNEFAQHVHDTSDDTILILKGEADLRQGDSRRRFREGECAFVPMGQIHGTVTAGSGETIMISFQNPPDMILYTGARDSKKPGAAPPKGVITPGAVKYMKYADKNGPVTTPGMGAQRGAFAHLKLKNGESFKTSGVADGEQLLFVKSGSIQVKDSSGTHRVGEKDTVFVQGAATLEATATSPDTVVIHVQAPPGKK